MSDKDIAALAHKHPNLHAAVVHGTLMEPNGDFVEVAKKYPTKESAQ